MADLIDRLSGLYFGPLEKIDVEIFLACYRGYAAGTVSAQEIQNLFQFEGQALTQAIALKNNIDSLGTKIDKIEYLLKVESVARLIERNDVSIYHDENRAVDKARVKNDLNW